MRSIKKVIIVCIFIITISIIFSNTNTVKAENMPQETIIEYSQNIDTKMLEEIKTSKFNVLAKPQVKVKATPEEADISKYYYNQLKNEISKTTYNTLQEQINNKIKINLNDYKCDISESTEDAATQSFQEKLFPYILDGYEAYIMDSPKNYWWTSDVKIGNIEVLISEKKATYKSVEIWSEMKEWSEYNKFNTKLKELSNSITGNNVYEIVKSINYYIMNNVEYTVIDDTDIEQTAYGALILNKAVCEGQAQLFNLLCREKGVQCINVYGYTNENSTATAHAWNYVYEPSKQQWYAVDVTWNNNYDDALYLMVGSNTIIKDAQFGKNHIAGFKQYKVQTYTPATPILATERYIEPITLDGNYMVNIQPNTTYESFSKEFSKDIQFTVKEKDKVIGGNDIIKTGQKFTTENRTYTLIVKGDINGDGLADIRDILGINKHRLNKVKLIDEFLKAGNVNNDEAVDIRDILQINKYRLGKINEL
ncbi:MAG: hypothetical protein IKF83_03390 [Clostridia bacterium]|nr:hypothetical protein [Clostridia bacterium]